MPTDAHFLAAIAAAPADRLPKLVYADWLDERDDVRGELIRLEEETRERVAWDDTLWKLKPRRNELRARVSAEWLTAMGYGLHCEPLFRGHPFPTDVRDAWRLIREAHERWTGEPVPDVGGHAERVAETERRLGVSLPACVREYVAFGFDWNHIRQRRKRRSHPRVHALHPMPGQPVLSFNRQGYFQFGLRVGDFTPTSDPPVVRYLPAWNDQGEPDTGRYELASDQPQASFTQFVFTQAFGLLAARSGELSDDIRRVDEVRARLHEQFPHVSTIGGAELFEAADLSATLRTPGQSSAGFLEVRAHRPISADRLSPWLLAVCRTDGYRTGVFRDIQRGYVNEQRVAVGLPPVDDDIPF